MTGSQRARFAAMLAALVLASLNLRPALTSVAPLMERMIADLELSAATAGLVTTIPVLMMGLLAPLAPTLAHRWTQERVLAGTLLLLGMALALRALSHHSVVWLLISAFAAGVSIAIAGPLMSGFIKQHFNRRMGLVIAAYSVSVTAGAALAVVATLPLTTALGDRWSWALSSWAVLAFVALLVWLLVVPSPAQQAKSVIHSEPLPLRSRQAWLFTVFFACQAGVFYALSTWLVARYEQISFPPQQASGFASLFMGAGIAGAFLVPLLLDKVADRRWLLFTVTMLSTLSLLLIAWYPTWLPGWVTSMLGIASAGTFALVLALPVLETDNARQAASLTSMMLCVGYLLGGCVPSLTGIGRDITQGYELPFTLLAALSAAMTVIALVLPATKEKANN